MVAPSLVNLDTPELAVAETHVIAVNNYPSLMQEIPASRMFEIKNALAKYKNKAGADAPIYDASQGDGGASLPGVSAEILNRAHELQLQHGTGYDQPYGTDIFRKATAEQYWQIDSATGWGPANILFAQGGRDALIKAYRAMIALGHGRIGDLLVVSRVPWISYNWGPYDIGLNVLHAPGQPDSAWQYTPEALRACADFARQNNRKIAGLVMTSPDNPTGHTLTLDRQIELAKVALENDYAFVLFDWIYHWISDGGHYDINPVLQAFTPEERERLIFLDGLTKSIGASNIRSAHLVASKKVVSYINSSASHGVIPSFHAQAVAMAAYEIGFEKAAATVIDACRGSREVLRRYFAEHPIPHILGDGYYAFIDLSRYLQAGNFADSAQLGAWLGENYGVTIVPGIYFSNAGSNWVRFSYALPPAKTEKAIQRMFEGLNSLL